MITIIDASTYTTKGAMAYDLTYSEGSRVRTVETKGQMIFTECFVQGAWVQTQKAYIITHSKKRNAEKIKVAVLKFLGK